MKRECGDWQLLEDVTGLAAGIMTAFSYMETFMEEFPEFPERETVLDFYFCLRDFLNVYEELDGHYRIYEENREDVYKRQYQEAARLRDEIRGLKEEADQNGKMV